MTMLSFSQPIETRDECWPLGIALRETLVARYMSTHHLNERPLLKKIASELLEESLGVRLRDDPLPLDRYAQTEVVHGRIVVTINSRIPSMPGVKDHTGTAYVSGWHEAVHVVRDVAAREMADWLSKLPLPGWELDVPTPRAKRLIICRATGGERRCFDRREFVAENAGLSAAISASDLQRCSAFARLQLLGANGGELDFRGWRLLQKTADFLGVNRSALFRYFERRGLLYVVEQHGRRTLMATRNLYRGLEWLEPDFGPRKFVA
jgi:hypothetical protein